MDVVVALPATWLLCVQMNQFYATGAGKDYFGENQAIAVEATKEILQRFTAMAKTIVDPKDFNGVQKHIRQWAKKNPFQSILFYRGHNYEFFTWAAKQKGKMGLMGTMKQVQDLMGRLSYQMSYLGQYMPLQSMWQMEVLVLDQLESVDLDSPESQLGNISESLETVTEMIQDREGLIDHLFYRTVQLLLLVLAGVLIILLVWKRLGSKPPA